MPEIVYDSFMNLKSFIDAHLDTFDTSDDILSYDIYDKLKSGDESNERLAEEELPADTGQRPSDLVAIIFNDCGITRQEYIDIVRLHLFKCYLAGFKQEDIYQGIGTLKVMLEDIPGILRLVPEGFPSNMMYHANQTYENIKFWFESTLYDGDQFDSPTHLLRLIHLSEENIEYFIGT